MAGSASVFVKQGIFKVNSWGNALIVTSIALSMIVNALVTFLIVVKIFKVFREVNLVRNAVDEEILGVTGGRKLQSIIFILIESGMVLFSVQFARMVVTMVPTAAGAGAFGIIASIHQMLNVIIRLIMSTFLKFY